MRARLVTVLLLLLFCGSLFAGAHPCQAQEPQDAQKTAPACHGHEAAPSVPNAPVPAGDQDTGEHHCEHACHMVALVQIPVSVFAAEPEAEMATPVIARSLPLFTPPIDHIPLA